MKIKRIHSDRYSIDELEKLDVALELFDFAINSVQFQRFIEIHEPFETQENFSNEQIYGIVMSGDEKYTNEGIDYEADLDLTIDPRNSTDAIGYTLRNRIYTFRNFFHQLLPTKLAGHYAHEYCHTLGFKHTFDFQDISKNVPYEVGRFVEELAIGSHRTYITTPGSLENTSLSNFRNASIVTDTNLNDAASATNLIPGTASMTKPSQPKVKQVKNAKKNIR
jgi:hypothetical protein